MKRDRHRGLLVCTHPVQYFAPILQRIAVHPKLDLQVAYCSLQPDTDPEFGIAFAWDVPLLEGYPWVQVPNHSWHAGLGRFWGLFNPGCWVWRVKAGATS
jgi:hypothetical protein